MPIRDQQVLQKPRQEQVNNSPTVLSVAQTEGDGPTTDMKLGIISTGYGPTQTLGSGQIPPRFEENELGIHTETGRNFDLKSILNPERQQRTHSRSVVLLSDSPYFLVPPAHKETTLSLP
jgi:hypothetical protein